VTGEATVILPTLSAARAGMALESLGAQTTGHRTIVVDNGSPGGEVADVCADFDFAESIVPGKNLGFSRAVNVAAAHALGDVLVIVNDDAIYEPDFVSSIIEPIDPDCGVTMAAGVLRSDRDSTRIDTAGIEIDRTLLAFDYLHGQLVSDAYAAGDPLGPSGAAAAYDRRSFLAIGGYDERLFAYFEDLDLALRMTLAGSSCRLSPQAQGTHAHSSTLGSGSREKNRLMGFARGYLLRKWAVLGPSRAPGVAVRELVLCLGQMLMDRNTGGLRGRLDGFRAAGTSGRRAFPGALVHDQATMTLRDSLGRRLGRRRMLRSI